jgi:membrane fusion protein (multidrug efflux system)
MRKKIILPVVGAVALTALGYYGYDWWTVGRFIESTDNAYVESDISVVSPKVEGYVRDVLVEDNQFVHAGDVLAVIDDEQFAARVAEAEAAVAAQQAAIASIDRQIALQQTRIAEAGASLHSADAEVDRAALDFERFAKLQEKGFAPKQRYEQASADFRKAQAAVAASQAGFAAAEQEVTVLAAARGEAEAKLKQAEAALALAQDDLDNAVIRAPVDGVIGNKSARVGQFVRAGTQLLAVVPLPDVYVVANFKETQLAAMRQGQLVSIEVDAYPGEVLTGTVESFAPASGAQFSLLPPENATGNFTKIVQRVPVRIAVPRDNALAGLLRPGLSVVVAVDTREPGSGPALANGVFGAAYAAVTRTAGE